MQNSKKVKYREFCREEKKLPIFARDWWLDVVCDEHNWHVALVEKEGKIIASLPYYLKKGLVSSTITMPPLTQVMGPYIDYPESQKQDKKLSYEKEIMDELIKQLPPFDLFIQHFHHSITNWLPFYWQGFIQSTRYTYVIDDLSDLNSVYANFSHAKRKNIKKAEKSVTIHFDLAAKDFYEHHKMTLKKQNEKISYDYNLFEKIYSSCYKFNAGKTIYAIDHQGNIHSALFVIWDSGSAYNLISTIDPDFKNSGSASLLVKEITSYVAHKTKKFDFEGSMIEGVERSFRQFGAKQVPYFLIYKDRRNIVQKGLNYIKTRL
jgi:hypothetical protein